jgi:hypothetical protein
MKFHNVTGIDLYFETTDDDYIHTFVFNRTTYCFFNELFFNTLRLIYSQVLLSSDKEYQDSLFSNLENIKIPTNTQWKLVYENGIQFEWTTLYDLCEKTSNLNIRSECESNTFTLFQK